MIARIQKSLNERDKGFTLIELLVVMIIIGILAAIAIPVFLNQRNKAYDTATKADVSNVAKEIAAYYVDGTDALADVLETNGVYQVQVTGPTTVVDNAGNVSDGVTIDVGTAGGATAWCIEGSNSLATSPTTYSYSAQGGLAEGAC